MLAQFLPITLDFDVLISTWNELLLPFGSNPMQIQQAFTEIVNAYSHPTRRYHNLSHIQSVLVTIQELQPFTQNFPAVQLAAWFHDVVYDSKAKNNEEKSAAYAHQVLIQLAVPLEIIGFVEHLIISTKTHIASFNDKDGQVLIDADLSILGAAPADYRIYANAIRKEYTWVTDIDYHLGRKRVLENFLQRSRIYFTELAFESLEQQARTNIQQELSGEWD
jgi:predicted metal-dependent HD superfamily phosphohydrolase